MLSFAVAKKNLHPPQPLRSTSGLFIKEESYEPKQTKFFKYENDKSQMANDLLRRIDETFWTNGDKDSENVKGAELISKIEAKIQIKKSTNKRIKPIKRVSDIQKQKESTELEQMSITEKPSKKKLLTKAKPKLINKETEEIYKKSIPCGFELDLLTEDDNSAFRCVSKHFFNDQNGHHSIRQKCVAYMRRKSSISKALLVKEDGDKYIKRMCETNVTADKTALILMAMSYKFNLNVFSPKDFKMYQIYYSEKFDNEIFMFETNNGHFHLLKKVDPECRFELVPMNPLQAIAPTSSISLEDNIEQDLKDFKEGGTRKKAKLLNEKNAKLEIKVIDISSGKVPPKKSLEATTNPAIINHYTQESTSFRKNRYKKNGKLVGKKQEKSENIDKSSITIGPIQNSRLSDIPINKILQPLDACGTIKRWDNVQPNTIPEPVTAISYPSPPAKSLITITDVTPPNHNSTKPVQVTAQINHQQKNADRENFKVRHNEYHHNRNYNNNEDNFSILTPCENPFCTRIHDMFIPVIPMMNSMGYSHFMTPFPHDINMYTTNDLRYDTPGLYHVDRHPEDLYEPVPQPIEVIYPQRYIVPESMQERLAEYHPPQFPYPPPEPTSTERNDTDILPTQQRDDNSLPINLEKGYTTADYTEHTKPLEHQ